MTNPVPNQPPQNNPIRGEPLDLAILLDFATIDTVDIEHAAQWWDDHASPDWVGALDEKPIDDKPNS